MKKKVLKNGSKIKRKKSYLWNPSLRGGKRLDEDWRDWSK